MKNPIIFHHRYANVKLVHEGEIPLLWHKSYRKLLVTEVSSQDFLTGLDKIHNNNAHGGVACKASQKIKRSTSSRA